GKVSIQVAARELRYAWFREIAGSRLILTGHHLDDNIETLLMNFFKGTGIAGLRAMLPRQGDILRPLLFATRERLLGFAEEHQLSWVEDSSNRSDKYGRNYIRHQIVPVVETLYPGVMENLGANIDRFREIEMVYRKAIGQQQKRLLEYRGAEVHIPVLQLKKMEPLLTLVHEIVTPYGFTPHQAGAVIDLLDSPSGKYVNSASHRILKNRRWLIISPLRTTGSVNILVESANDLVQYGNGVLRLESLPITAAPAELTAAKPSSDGKTKVGSHPATGKHTRTGPSHNPITWLDADLIKFPLLLRRWQTGDYFYPLGMRKKKKLSRFFIDNKLSLADKEKIWVLEMDKKIIWVVGLRIDDRFRITPSTRQVLKVETGMH
ncbi:MAG TPA: tRNA lysidine(34) synthetase TilS, partial [Puia sp.]|nr:tRNA lysidine(34) synthetase TilS [Puia sp.]